MPYQITSAIIGLMLASMILWLIRRDQMNIRHAAWWLIIVLIIVFFGIFPSAIDIIASKLGVNYPPTLFLILSIGMILIKILNRDIEQSKLERKIRRLAQKLALLEAEMAESGSRESGTGSREQGIALENQGREGKNQGLESKNLESGNHESEES